ncbi:insulinase family protein [Candidatus Woesearchaeota archaeon]|nr:insulinase family protein [Candidatus Woesearchaeota archaeon]
MVEIQRREYKNGLIAVAVPLAGKKKAAFYVGIDVGSKNESRDKKGCAHLLEHMMFRKNDFRNSDQIAEEAEFNGMELNAQTSLTDTRLKLWLPPERLGLAVELTYQSIASGSYDPQEFQSEKNGPVTAELVAYERNPTQRYVRRVLFPRIFEGTPLEDAVTGTFDSVKGLEVSDLVRMKRDFYVSNNMVVTATGAVDPERFFEEEGKYFGNLAEREVTQPDVSWRLRPGVTYVEFDDLKDPQKDAQDQAAVYVVYQVHGAQHEDAAGLCLAQTMLGEGFTSYLFRELRKERGIGYSPEASYLSMRGNAVFMMGLPALHPNQLEEAVDVISNIVQRVKGGHIDQAFFKGKKTQLRSLVLSLLEKNSFHADTAIGREFEKPHYTPESLMRRIDEMTLGCLQDIARRNLSGDSLIVAASAPGYNNRLTGR